MARTIFIDGTLADAMGSLKLQELADAAAKASRNAVELVTDSVSKYHADKVFEGRVNPPPPLRSFRVSAGIKFHVTARTVEEAAKTAEDYLEESDFIGSYGSIEVTDDNAEVLAP